MSILREFIMTKVNELSANKPSLDLSYVPKFCNKRYSICVKVSMCEILRVIHNFPLSILKKVH